MAKTARHGTNNIVAALNISPRRAPLAGSGLDTREDAATTEIFVGLQAQEKAEKKSRNAKFNTDYTEGKHGKKMPKVQHAECGTLYLLQFPK